MKYLGLDLGKKSLGIAISDRTGLIATFYKNIRYEDENKLIEELLQIINKEDGSIVIQDENYMKLEPITTEKEWKVIETALRVLQEDLKGTTDDKAEE